MQLAFLFGLFNWLRKWGQFDCFENKPGTSYKRILCYRTINSIWTISPGFHLSIQLFIWTDIRVPSVPKEDTKTIHNNSYKVDSVYSYKCSTRIVNTHLHYTIFSKIAVNFNAEVGST